jgi:hypothetical protein
MRLTFRQYKIEPDELKEIIVAHIQRKFGANLYVDRTSIGDHEAETMVDDYTLHVWLRIKERMV